MTDVVKMLEALQVTDFPEEFKRDYQSKLTVQSIVQQVADAPFHYTFYNVNYDGSVYLAQQVVADRNNRVTRC